MKPQWNPSQYEKFRAERLAPFGDLLALLAGLGAFAEAPRVIDLGCGNGEITALLYDALSASSGLGLDSSAEMLAQSGAHTRPGLSFAQRDLRDALGELGSYDVVFSHAALQWVPEGEATFRRLLSGMKPGARLAVQVPKNEAHPSHALAAALAQEEPFASHFRGFSRASYALPLERYAELLHQHEFSQVSCLEKIYVHRLESADAVVEWVKGTLLLAYLGRLPEALHEAFLEQYRERLRAALGEARPYLYPFRRALLCGVAPAQTK